MFSSLSVKRLYDELDYWIFIGIGEDIVLMPKSRPEYQHLVYKHKLFLDDSEVPRAVLADLSLELKNPWYKRKTLWHLLSLNLKRFFGII